VEIATHVNGVSIGDPRFEPFFAAAERLGAAIFVHALHPAGRDRLVGPAAQEQVVAFPGDVALGIASLITGGTLERHSSLRIGFSHGGGAFAMLLPRMQHAWHAIPKVKESVPRSPEEYARRLYYDTLTYSATACPAVWPAVLRNVRFLAEKPLPRTKVLALFVVLPAVEAVSL